jgi:hypothetical protein
MQVEVEKGIPVMAKNRGGPSREKALRAIHPFEVRPNSA